MLLPWHHQPDHLGASRGGDEAAFHRRQTEARQWEVEDVDQGGGEAEEGGGAGGGGGVGSGGTGGATPGAGQEGQEASEDNKYLQLPWKLKIRPSNVL